MAAFSVIVLICSFCVNVVLVFLLGVLVGVFFGFVLVAAALSINNEAIRMLTRAVEREASGSSAAAAATIDPRQNCLPGGNNVPRSLWRRRILGLLWQFMSWKFTEPEKILPLGVAPAKGDNEKNIFSHPPLLGIAYISFCCGCGPSVQTNTAVGFYLTIFYVMYVPLFTFCLVVGFV